MLLRLWPAVCCLVFRVASGGFIVRRHLGRSLGLPGRPTDGLPIEEWLAQKLDHFDFNNRRVWPQRYFTNTSWFQKTKNSPVFLMIGGGEQIHPEWMVEGAWMDLAQKYSALCFQLEHRFYGLSQPTGNLSFTSYHYLSSQQALGDIAYFISDMATKYGLTADNKWVLFGGGYSGALAVWARMKYPHLVHAVVSTSSPVHLVVDYPGFDAVVSTALNTADPSCAKNVRMAAVEVQDALEKPETVQELTDKFNLCAALDPANKQDVLTLIESLSGIFQNVMLFNKVNRIPPSLEAMGPIDHLGLENICKIMTNESIARHLDRLSAVSSLVFGSEECIDVSYSKGIKEVKLESIGSHSDARSWMYQMCSELGLYTVGSNGSESLFGILPTTEFFVDQCEDIFGSSFDMRRIFTGVSWTNQMYGGLDVVKHVTNVVFVQGSLDPWHLLGVTKSDYPGAPALLMNGTAHCASMFPPLSEDPPELVEGRAVVDHLLQQWLVVQDPFADAGFAPVDSQSPHASEVPDSNFQKVN